MVVVDANAVSGFEHRDHRRLSPVVHAAVQNLLDGLRNRDDIEVYVVYGQPSERLSEPRRDGCLRFLPVAYRRCPGVPGMGGSFLGRLRALVRAVRKLDPDVVHGQGTEREAGMVAVLCGKPSIITLHGNMRELARTANSRLFSYFGVASTLERWVLPRATIVHCISRHAEKSVKALTCATQVIPNSVSPVFYRVRRQQSHHPVIVCMAGISEWKNPLLLVRAGDPLQKLFPKTEIHFFGAANPGHPYAASFLREVEERPWCQFHGLRPPAELAKILTRATCSVLPSKQENFGLALAEAMAAGVTPVGANVGGVPDVITEGRTGLVFDPEEPSELAALLVSLHRNPERLEGFAAAARSDAFRRFTIEVVTQKHLELYDEVISRSRIS